MMTELKGGNSDIQFTIEGIFRRNAVLALNNQHHFCCNDITAEYILVKSLCSVSLHNFHKRKTKIVCHYHCFRSHDTHAYYSIIQHFLLIKLANKNVYMSF